MDYYKIKLKRKENAFAKILTYLYLGTLISNLVNYIIHIKGLNCD